MVIRKDTPMNRDEITKIAHTTEDSKVEYWTRELMTYMNLAKLLHEPSKLATIPEYPLNPISVTLRET